MSTLRPPLMPYLDALERLSHRAWLTSSASRQRSSAPVWFREMVVARGMGLLTLVWEAPEPWVVFPDVLPGFSGVALRKTPNRLDVPPLARLQVRFFHGQEALDMEHLVQNALAGCLRHHEREHPGPVRFADEHLLLFVFRTGHLNDALLRLGLPAEALEQRPWIHEGDVDWAAAGL